MNLDLGYTRLIIKECEKASLSIRDTAYVLATAYWETNRTMEPVREAYYLGSKAETYRKSLRYYPYYGRGFVQLTWDYNYKKVSPMVGVDCFKKPDVVMEPYTAAKILVLGMKNGWFTGKKLSDYKTLYSARAVVNGDKDKLIDGKKLGLVIQEIAEDYITDLSAIPSIEPEVAPPEAKTPVWLQWVISIILRLLGRF